MVLLHLVGVSTDLPPPSFFRIFWNDAGIVGVNPALFLLERSDPSQQGLLDLQPHWLQDAHDQKCLGLMGTFSECGDATMWRVIPRAKRHARRRQWIRWATEDDDLDWDVPQGYALQVFYGTNNCCQDDIARGSPSNMCSGLSGKSGFNNEDYSNNECLTRRRKDNKLVMVPCSEDRAWFWKVNELGILHFEKPGRGMRKSNHKKKLLNKRQSFECVWRNASVAVLLPCDGRDPSKLINSTSMHDVDERVVQFQFLRQVNKRDLQSPDAEATKLTTDGEVMKVDPNPDTSEDNVEKQSWVSTLPYAFGGLPSLMDIAHTHAKASVRQTEPRSGSRTPSILPQRPSEVVSKKVPRFLGDTNPILVASTNRTVGGSIRVQGPRRTVMEEKLSRQPTSTSSVVHEGSLSHATRPAVRKIQINPYIAASKEERWKDPQTGLVYSTDLCRYLGHERKDVGRHTLTGVGQYTKTMLNIKVRSVSLLGCLSDGHVAALRHHLTLFS